jgi:NADH:ubiquinone oxidoreductase subunit 2 (subunit N)
VIAAINTVIALVYYARVAKVVWMDPAPETAPAGRDRPVATSLGLVLGIAAVITVVLGFLPGIVAAFADATRVIVAGG